MAGISKAARCFRCFGVLLDLEEFFPPTLFREEEVEEEEVLWVEAGEGDEAEEEGAVSSVASQTIK